MEALVNKEYPSNLIKVLNIEECGELTESKLIGLECLLGRLGQKGEACRDFFKFDLSFEEIQKKYKLEKVNMEGFIDILSYCIKSHGMFEMVTLGYYEYLKKLRNEIEAQGLRNIERYKEIRKNLDNALFKVMHDDLEIRTYNVLMLYAHKTDKYLTIKDLESLSDEELLAFPHAKPKVITNLREVLKYTRKYYEVDYLEGRKYTSAFINRLAGSSEQADKIKLNNDCLRRLDNVVNKLYSNGDRDSKITLSIMTCLGTDIVPKQICLAYEISNYRYNKLLKNACETIMSDENRSYIIDGNEKVDNMELKDG